MPVEWFDFSFNQMVVIIKFYLVLAPKRVISWSYFMTFWCHGKFHHYVIDI